MHPLLSKISYKWLTVASIISVLVLLGILFIFKGNVGDVVYSTVTNILVSILTCILVSFWWNKLLLDASSHYSKSGIKHYYSDFSEVEPIIKKKLEKANEVTIFFMYGKTFINGSSSQIKKILSKKGNKLIFVVGYVDNPFIEQYEEFWNYPIKENIKNTPDNLLKLFNEIDPGIRAHLQIYLYKQGGYCYSYFKIDNEIFLSPNKMVEAKSFKPITLHAKKVLGKKCLYRKINQEFNFMLEAKQIEIFFDSMENNSIEVAD
ncbi:hypothetical protein AS4_28130 [Acinetobacter guillouiae]|uniref:hypothetical protein n=1 Tax=Acinetobacter guillouiae TaxID=106649 RepID=UPI0004EF6027|nr:hypothetical protein [Acinetobacter guillouiae]BAP37753.1 hypothetical protein AS4_28130 [Acinetobacter guillouiae]